MKYEILFKNGTRIKFSSSEDVVLHNINMEQPLVFNDLLVNLTEVIVIKKEQET